MVWNEQRIIQTLKQLHQEGKPLSYNALAKKKQSLVSAAAYHFGSYRRAVERAGIAYAEVLRRPRWSKQHIIAVIKKAKREGLDLHWSSVTKRRDELGKAAFASLQKRLFGSWDRALHGAGLDSDEISPYQRWDKSTILFEIKTLHRENEPLNSGAMQRSSPGLHAAAVRHFGAYDVALKAAGIKPEKVRQRRTWTRPGIVAAIRAAGGSKRKLSDSSVRKSHPALYGAALREFGTFTKALKSVEVSDKRKSRH